MSHLSVIPIPQSREKDLRSCFWVLPPAMNFRDPSLCSVESHVIPAKAGIHRSWVPACVGTTKFATFRPMATEVDSKPRRDDRQLTTDHEPSTRDCSCQPYNLRKFASNCFPDWVSIDSGWNCTPSTFIWRCRRPIIRPSGEVAEISRQAGRLSRSTISEW